VVGRNLPDKIMKRWVSPRCPSRNCKYTPVMMAV
jgi:hypothetical protein